MHVEFGGRVADDVLVVLGVVAAEEGPEAVAEVAVDVAVLVQGAVVAQDHHRRLDRRLVEGRGLPHEAFHQAFVALGEHGRHGVPLGREVEEQEIVVLLVHQPRTPLGDINVGDFVFLRVGRHLEVGEGKAVVVVEALRVAAADRVAVEHIVADVETVGSESNVEAVRGRAHGEHVAATCHELTNLLDHSEFQLRYLAEAPTLCRGFLHTHILLIPGVVAVARPELAILSREVLVVRPAAPRRHR